MASINQSLHRDALPDFRNLGVMLRVVFIVLLLAGFAALTRTASLAHLFDSFLEVLAPVQPVLVASLLALWAASRRLRALPYAHGMALVVCMELAIVVLAYWAGQRLFPDDRYDSLTRYALSQVAMERTLRMGEQALAAIGETVRPPCDAEGRAL